LAEGDFPPGFDVLKAQWTGNGHAGNDQSGEPLTPIDPASLDGVPVPPRRWLVADWIPMARATSIYGAGGEGKTLLTQMLATCCAIGAKWLGLPVRRCNSLLLFCEDDTDEMHRRQEDINSHYGCTFADLGAMRWLPRLGEDNVLMTFDNGRAHRSPLFDQLLASSMEHDAKLIVTDTLADVFSGNENDRGQARMFAQSILGHIARETGAASVTCAHPSLSGMANSSTGSGSTAWKGTFRSQLYMESPKAEEGEQPDPDIRVLRRAKANFARRDEMIEIQWKAGVFVPLRAPSGIIGSIERRTAKRVFLDLLYAVTAENRHVSDSPHARNFAPKLFAQRPDREGFRKADFKVAMEALFAEKEIALERYRGPNRYEYERIVRTQNSAVPAKDARRQTEEQP
jgi:RecA-family ATPase